MPPPACPDIPLPTDADAPSDDGREASWWRDARTLLSRCPTDRRWHVVERLVGAWLAALQQQVTAVVCDGARAAPCVSDAPRSVSRRGDPTAPMAWSLIDPRAIGAPVPWLLDAAEAHVWTAARSDAPDTCAPGRAAVWLVHALASCAPAAVDIQLGWALAVVARAEAHLVGATVPSAHFLTVPDPADRELSGAVAVVLGEAFSPVPDAVALFGASLTDADRAWMMRALGTAPLWRALWAAATRWPSNAQQAATAWDPWWTVWAAGSSGLPVGWADEAVRGLERLPAAAASEWAAGLTAHLPSAAAPLAERLIGRLGAMGSGHDGLALRVAAALSAPAVVSCVGPSADTALLTALRRDSLTDHPDVLALWDRAYLRRASGGAHRDGAARRL